MLIKLVKYEFEKKWKTLRFVLLGYLLLQILLLFLTRSLFWAGDYAKIFTQNREDFTGISVPFIVTMLLYFGLAVSIGLFSFFEAMYRFGRDLSGKQAVLELMLPITSGKKIVSKIIINLCSNIVCIGLSAFSIMIFILINSNFEKSIVNGILNWITQIVQSPGRTILVSVYIMFCFASLYAVVFCCIAFSKSISNKRKISIPVGIASLACFIAVWCVYANTLLIERFPIINYTILGEKNSLSSDMMNIIIFSGALFVTSWLMENKTEC
jgi:hypothetical protein